ncbi:MAG TPA: hypothetical protein VGK18_12215 [Propionicimonas sp.]|uniref:hypothetical protein n=1 Tax=Propionicimonas sp. TaxID=1955623 RepID=UPI002F408C1E
MQGFFDFIATVLLVIWGVLTGDDSIADWFALHPLTTEMALTIAALAGISTLFGDSVVLFLNRVRGWRFVVTMALNALGFVLLYALQALVIAIVGPLIAGRTPGLATVTQGVMLATAPMIFGFLVLIPYLGPAIARLLQVWGLLVLWLVNEVLFQTDLWTALLITGIGWGVMQLLSWSLARPVNWIGDRIWRLATGTPSMMTGRDLLSGHMFMPLDYPPELEEKH